MSPILTGEVTTKVRSFTGLFGESTHSLAIDTYQRGFVWGEDKIKQLIQDLQEFSESVSRQPEDTPDYYMGTLLLHDHAEKGKCFVIDGQQRLTALCVLHCHLRKALPEKSNMEYRSVESARNIKRAWQCFQSIGKSWPADLFDRICFTVIEVPSEDLAFTFFDTQNNRGVPLHATDLLKAFHLRSIQEPCREFLQTNCAKRWERLQRTQPILGLAGDFAPSLFNEFLWRARRWTGQNLKFESHDELILEFQERTRPGDKSSATIPLFRSHHNRLGTSLTLHEAGDYELTTHPIRLSDRPAELPFALRQPVNRGIGFFLFADKYAALTHELLNGKHSHPEVRAFNDFYRRVVAGISVYLREAFLLSVVMYVDQFGFKRLLEFALRLDHVLGAIRIEKHYVFRETAKNFFRDKPLNLLDVIAGAFIPDDVMDYLMQDKAADQQYKDNEALAAGDGVRGRYKQQVLEYYGRAGSLDGKQRWITPEWCEVQIQQRVIS